MKVHTIVCSCGNAFRLTDIQFCDFDCGMMGFLFCECGRVVLPSKNQGVMKTNTGLDKNNVVPMKTETIELEGEDPGWSNGAIG